MARMTLQLLRAPVVAKKQIRRQGVNKSSATQAVSASTWTTINPVVVNSSYPNTTIVGGNGITLEEVGPVIVSVNVVFSVTTANAKQWRVLLNGSVIFTSTSTSVGNIVASTTIFTPITATGTITVQVFTSASRTIVANTAGIITMVAAPIVFQKNGVDQALAPNVWTAVENYGKTQAWGNRVNSAIQVDTPGPYTASVQTLFGLSASHQLRILRNGVPLYITTATTSTLPSGTSGLISLAAGDLITSGGLTAASSGDSIKRDPTSTLTLIPQY